MVHAFWRRQLAQPLLLGQRKHLADRIVRIAQHERMAASRMSFLKLDSSNIILAQTPVFMGVPNVGKTDSFNGYSCVVPDAGSIAALLNQYFCTYTGPIDVSEMHLVTDQWPHGTASTDANVQYMGRIDKESDDAILNGNTDLSGAVTTDGQAAGSAN